MRDDVLMELVRRAQDDPEFRRAVLADPERALAEQGLELSPEELAAVREFHAGVSGLADADVHARLAAAARESGMM